MPIFVHLRDIGVRVNADQIVSMHVFEAIDGEASYGQPPQPRQTQLRMSSGEIIVTEMTPGEILEEVKSIAGLRM